MNNKTIYDVNMAIERIKNYCSLQDRCKLDVLNKMKEWGLQQSTKDHILEKLINEQYVDEKRFSSSFCRGKFKIKKWGRIKIVNELKRKKISTIYINNALKEIDKNDYIQVLEELLHKKKEEIKEKNHHIRKRKIGRFLIQRGFESDMVWEKLRKLSNK